MRLWRRVIQRFFMALYRARVSVLLALVVGLGAAEYLAWRNNVLAEAAPAGVFPVEVSVQPIRIQNNGLTLTLKEKNGDRRISMNIGGAEAMVIAHERGPRVPGDVPQAYDLTRDMVDQLGGKVDHVIINDANSSTYFAQVVLSVYGESKSINAKPGDAVALALKTSAPIYVEDKVLEQYGTKGSS